MEAVENIEFSGECPPFSQSDPPNIVGSERLNCRVQYGNVWVPLFVIEALERHGMRQNAERLKAGPSWQDNDLVFCNTYGGYFHPAHLYTMFQQLLKKAELSSMRFHDLRHSAATILRAMDKHVKVIQELLGQSNTALTLNVYKHAPPSMQRGDGEVG